MPSVVAQIPGYTVISVLPLAGEPAQIQESTHGYAELFKSGILVNKDTRAITQYKIGYVTVMNDGTTQVRTGNFIVARNRIKWGDSDRIPAQLVDGSKILPSAKKVLFFIAEVQFENGTAYVANLADVQKAAIAEPTTASK